MQSVGGASPSRIAGALAPRRTGSTASPHRAGIAASGTGRWVTSPTALATRASIVRSSSGGETSSSSLGCAPVGAASPVSRQPPGLSSWKIPRGACASASAPARSPRCLAARVSSFAVGTRPVARDASRRPEVSARAAEGSGRVSTIDSPASSDDDAEADRDRDPSSPAVAPDGSDPEKRAENDKDDAAGAPRARPRYRKRRPSRARRWDRPVDGALDESVGTGSGTGSAPPPSDSTQSGWAELRRRGLRDDASSSSPFAGASGDLAGLGFGGGFGGSNGGGGGGGGGGGRGPRPLRGKALTRRIKQLGDRRRLDAVFELLDVSPVPETTNGRRITVGAVIGACCKCGDLERGLKLLQQLDGPGGVGAGAPAYCALIQAHGRAGRLREALLLLDAWEKGRGPRDSKIGVGRNGTIYVAGSGKWRKKDVPLRGEKWRDEMGTVWHPPRVAQSRMLLTVLDACASCGDVARAREFKDRVLRWEGRVVDARMAFDGVSDAEAAWNAVAKAHAMSDDPLSCLGVLREMETCAEDPIEPSQCTYNIAVMACQRGGRPDWARAMIGRMRKIAARTGDPNMYPDAVTYTTAARAEAAAARGYTGAEHAGGVEAVEAMYAEVRGPLGPPPDPQCYGAIIDAFVAYGALSQALAAVYTAENEPGVDLSARVYLGVMRAQAATGDVEGVAALAERLEKELRGRAAKRDAAAAERAMSRGGKDRAAAAKEEMRNVERDIAAAAAAAVSVGGDLRSGRYLGASGGAAVEAEVVMCEAEAKAAAGDVVGSRAALERLKRLDYAASSRVLRERSTELLVSLFVKEIVGRSDDAAAEMSDAFESTGDAFVAGETHDQCVVEEVSDDVGDSVGFMNCATTPKSRGKSMWGVTQALDLIDSAWGFASLDEDDEFLPSLDEDDIPIPAAGGFGGFLNTAVKRSGWSDIAEGPYPGGGDWTSPADWTSPTLRSSEAADALELWTGAASKLFAGEAEPLMFRGGVDPAALLSEEPDLGLTIDEGDEDDARSEPAAESARGWFSSPVGAGREGTFRFVVRVDEPAGAAAEAVGRDFVAVVIDGDLRPVGTLMGCGSASEVAPGIQVGDVMGPKPASIEGENATVGDVAVICAAAAHDEPVAVVDARGRLTRVLRREDLLEPARSDVGRDNRFDAGRRATNDPR